MIRFRTQVYRLTSSKIPEGKKLKAAFLTDLHGREFGLGNQALLEEIRRQQPDLVLCAGDMIVRTLSQSIFVAKGASFEAFRRISGLYGPGQS